MNNESLPDYKKKFL